MEFALDFPNMIDFRIALLGLAKLSTLKHKTIITGPKSAAQKFPIFLEFLV